MKFKEALKLIIKGKKIRRKCWGNGDYCVTTNFINLEPDDYAGEDWEEFIKSNRQRSWFPCLKQKTMKKIQDEISFLNYLIEYPELCVEKCKERKDMFKAGIKIIDVKEVNEEMIETMLSKVTVSEDKK